MGELPSGRGCSPVWPVGRGMRSLSGNEGIGGTVITWALKGWFSFTHWEIRRKNSWGLGTVLYLINILLSRFFAFLHNRLPNLFLQLSLHALTYTPSHFRPPFNLLLRPRFSSHFLHFIFLYPLFRAFLFSTVARIGLSFAK